MTTIRVLISESRILIRQGVRAVLDGEHQICVVGEAVDGIETIAMIADLQPDVVVMDPDLPRLGGIDAARWVAANHLHHTTSILMLGSPDDRQQVHEALAAGVRGFLPRDAQPTQLVNAIRTVATGDTILGRSALRHLVAPTPAVDSQGRLLDTLTPREADVFHLLADGYDSKEIAGQLVVGESTVKSHIQHVYQKLNLRNRVDVVIFAYENGMRRHRVESRNLTV